MTTESAQQTKDEKCEKRGIYIRPTKEECQGKDLSEIVADDDSYLRTYDVLVHSDNEYHRRDAAKYGDDNHRDILVYDPAPIVRSMVAEYGNDDQRAKLASDPDPEVLKTVVKYSDGETREKAQKSLEEVLEKLHENKQEERPKFINWNGTFVQVNN